ncbi:FAD-dependent oxidoreductase [bacterium]|nr:FAD-dependent oxidoreductase [bacterium]
MSPNPQADLAIVGGGAAGMAAALYSSRATLNVVLFEGATPGGQIALTDEVENYPGLGVEEPITGPEIAGLFQQHAEKFGTKVEYALVEKVSGKAGAFSLETTAGVWVARALMVAPGSSARAIGIPGEKEMMGRGVSTCATCDGPFFRGREVVVIGGGDSALQEALFLTKFASKVTVVHRRQGFSASTALVKRAQAHDGIDWKLDCVPEAILGEGVVEGVRIRHLPSDTVEDFVTSGVFIFIGHTPNTAFLQGFVDLDASGYVVVNRDQATSRSGVWAAGDCADHQYKQLITSAGDGVKAALNAIHFLETH